MLQWWQGKLNNSFSSFGRSFPSLDPKILEALDVFGFQTMTEIQEKTLPLTLERKDIIAKAKTGSGKTLAFGIPLLHHLDVKRFHIQGVVLAPTRELANQIADELKKLAKFTHNLKILTLCGGSPYRPQVESLRHSAHIVVGTPGRVLKHLKEGNFASNKIDTLILDEADRMLDMGFYDDISEIISYFPKNRHTMLFSATYPQKIAQLSNSILDNPVMVEVEAIHNETKILKKIYSVNANRRSDAIMNLLNYYQPESTIIFCTMKIECDELADRLEEYDIYPLVLHSDLDQKQRDEALTLFGNKSYKILIATDVAARGLDIESVDLVINHSLPRDTEVFIHRIGRTARGEKNGTAISLITEEERDVFLELCEIYSLEDTLELLPTPASKYNDTPHYRSIFINGGKKQKISRGDIVGAITSGLGYDKGVIGKIDCKDLCSFVALDPRVAKEIADKLGNTKIKGKLYRVYIK